jgi:hypothetical protein
MTRVFKGLKMDSMEKRRMFFKGSGIDIWSLIEYAILFFASDCPNEFRGYIGRHIDCMHLGFSGVLSVILLFWLNPMMTLLSMQMRVSRVTMIKQ